MMKYDLRAIKNSSKSFIEMLLNFFVKNKEEHLYLCIVVCSQKTIEKLVLRPVNPYQTWRKLAYLKFKMSYVLESRKFIAS